MTSIKSRSAYCDYRSLEASTGIIKKKYHLAGCYPPGVEAYPFFAITKNRFLNKGCTVEIKQSDWQYRHQYHLRHDVSFIDVRNVQILTRGEIRTKRQEAHNGFPRIAQLCEKKFYELKKVGDSVHRTGYIPIEKLRIITGALTEEAIAKNNLQRLGL